MDMATCMTYVICALLTVLFLVFARCAWCGWEGDNFSPSICDFIGTIAFLALAVFAASPMVYEYPPFVGDYIVVERTDDGRNIIEHPRGTFCYEGNDRFMTVPSREYEELIMRAVDKGSRRDDGMVASGVVVVTDYQKLLTYLSGLEGGASSLSDIEMAISDIGNDTFDRVARETPELLELIRPESPGEQMEFRLLLEPRMNQYLADRGLKFQAHRFWYS